MNAHRAVTLLAGTWLACSSFSGNDSPALPAVDGGVDAGVDADPPEPRGDPPDGGARASTPRNCPVGSPLKNSKAVAFVGGVTPGNWIHPRLTDDELTMYVTEVPATNTEGNAKPYRILVASRTTKSDPFSAPRQATELSDAFANRADSGGVLDAWVSSRGDAVYFTHLVRSPTVYGETWAVLKQGEGWTNPGHVHLTDADGESASYLADDTRRTAYFTKAPRTNLFDADIYRVTRDADGTFGAAQPVVTGAAIDSAPMLSADGLEMFFQRTPVLGQAARIMLATRALGSADFDPPAAFATDFVNNGTNQPNELPGWLTADACHFYWSRAESASDPYVLYVSDR